MKTFLALLLLGLTTQAAVLYPSQPGGGGGSSFPLTTDANFNGFGGTNVSKIVFVGGGSITSAPAGAPLVFSFTNGVLFTNSLTGGLLKLPPTNNLVNGILTQVAADGTTAMQAAGSESGIATLNGNGTNTHFYGATSFGTNTVSGMTVIDGNGNLTYYGPNALLVVYDNNTNPVFTASGTKGITSVIGYLYISNLTSQIYKFPTGTNTLLMSIGTNGGGGFTTNIFYIGNGVTSNEFWFANASGQAVLKVQTNGAAQIGTNSQVTIDASGNLSTVAIMSATNGMASYRSNSLAPFAFTFPATTVNWTNPINASIEVYIDNSGVTGTVIKKNGGQIASSLVGDAIFGLQPGEYFSETFSVGTPVGKWSPFP